MLNKVGTKTIETSRLILRKFSLSDNENMLKNFIADEEVQSLYCEPAYKTSKAVAELLELYTKNYEKDHCYRWAVILKENNECIGQIAYFLVDDKNHFAEIEYCIGAKFQGMGLATEAARAAVKYGFDEINLHKVQICHLDSNEKSKRVIEKCGLKYDGTLRDYYYRNNQYANRLYYSILKHEYENQEA